MQRFPLQERTFASPLADEELLPSNDEPEQLPESVCADEERFNAGDVPSTFSDDDGGGSAFPEEEAHVDNDKDELRSTSVEKSTEDTHDQSNEQEEPSTASRSKNGDDQVEEPPKKREKRIKSEVDVKVEAIEQEYFTKSAERNTVPLRDRFKIVEPRTLVRSEDVIFMHQKPIGRRVVTEYKFEDFIRPGLLRKGQYPHMFLEFKGHDNRVENAFNGILKKSADINNVRTNSVDDCETDLDVYDEWLATFGGFRILLEEGDPNFDDNIVEQCNDLASQRNGNKENDSTHFDDNCHGIFDDSTSSFFSSGNTTKRDRFNDIRPDEYKAIGIDVKNIVPNKDFYSMTKEERAAAVAAEFEAIDALGPKKEDGYVISIMDFSCRVSSYHLNTARMKRVMKSILSNPLLAYDKVLYTRRALLARRRAVERSKLNDSELIDPNEIYYKKLDRSLDASLGHFAEKILEENNPMDITALDPVDVLEAVTYRNLEGMVDAEELPNNCHESTKGGVEESMRQFAAEVRQSDFKVQGLHTFSSVMQCLPRRMGNSGRYVNIANALAVTLYMCNENTLTLVQERSNTMDLNESVNEGEPWMGNFIITNAQDALLFQGNVFGNEDLSSITEPNPQVDSSVPS
ncbi:hypothetical protein OESDEN_02501 [Oesophagostomum dentatum]|uniref:Condensin complex subunit 2 n=1 Tax=Oesophagostomum dentatum TaxID=61180 RepID=A0A0B1TIY3_OESDE|nr:hypothetical protein OESDEN_02501 [Oesophagostomum dentatum]